MLKTTVYLDGDVALALRRLAETRGSSQADLIREALRTYTSQAERPELPGVGKFRSGRKDVSERAEDILRKAASSRRWRS